MSLTAEDVRKRAMALSPSERASIAHDLILSLDKPSGLALDEERESEIRRRVQMVKQGKATGYPAGDVFSEIENSLE